jgi:hypothetical protein
MKKLITIAIVAVLGGFAFNASAKRGVLQVIKFDLVYQVQGSNIVTTSTSGSVTTTVNKTQKGDKIHITSKDILNLIATVFETNFPSGSKLAFDGGEFLVVDSTGENVIFYPDEATPPGGSEWGFNCNTMEGIQWGKDVFNSLGDYTDDVTMRSVIHIFLYNYPAPEPSLKAASELNTDIFDLSLGGLITQDYTYKYDHSNYTWKTKGNCKMTGLAGAGSLGDQYGVLTGSAKASGSEHGTAE